MKSKLTHLNDRGEALMVDVSEKASVLRIAEAEGRVRLQTATLQLISGGGIAKGDVLAVARVAGIQAAKQTAVLIPLCHQIPLSKVQVIFEEEPDAIRVLAEVRTVASTGVEMEALTAVSVALLTIYDMCKAVDTTMQIDSVQLLKKQKFDGNNR